MAVTRRYYVVRSLVRIAFWTVVAYAALKLAQAWAIWSWSLGDRL